MADKLLGDKIEELIEKTVPELARRAKKRGCGCAKRKKWLNDKDKQLRRTLKK